MHGEQSGWRDKLEREIKHGEQPLIPALEERSKVLEWFPWKKGSEDPEE